jgi:NAD-dependent deacetylase
MNSTNLETIQSIVRILKKSRSILFITGAGISADSGLPTYRGIAGLYNDKTTDDGVSIEMALAGEMLATRPEITWKYVSQIEKKCRTATYNRAHTIIAEMEKLFERVVVLTQNIDGFHHQAGSRNIIDIHGNMHVLMCTHCAWKETVESYEHLEIPPRCPVCKKIARPDVVFFGELLDPNKIDRLEKELRRGFDVYFSIGTTSVFSYIQEPILDAKRKGRVTIEINPTQTCLSEMFDIRLQMNAAEAMESILHEFFVVDS